MAFQWKKSGVVHGYGRHRLDATTTADVSQTAEFFFQLVLSVEQYETSALRDNSMPSNTFKQKLKTQIFLPVRRVCGISVIYFIPFTSVSFGYLLTCSLSAYSSLFYGQAMSVQLYGCVCLARRGDSDAAEEDNTSGDGPRASKDTAYRNQRETRGRQQKP